MKYFGLISLFISLALITGVVIYLSNRLALFFPSIPQKVYIWGFIALFIITFLSKTLLQTTENPIEKTLLIFGGIASSIFIFLLLSVAVIDLFNLIFKFSIQIRSILSIGLALLFTIYGIWNAYSVHIKEITIPVKGLMQEVNAVHLTDVHLGNFRGRKQVERIVRLIKELNPDVIFNTGDMFDSKVYFTDGDDVLAAFRTLNTPHYFVYGNHDVYVGVENVIKRMNDVNATVLLNKVVYFGELQIIGLNNMRPASNALDMHATGDSETIEDVLNQLEINKEYPTILLHHRPAGVKYMQEKGANLLLAGHTHAGQIFPFTLMAKLIFGYNRGIYKYKTMDIYVSEGAGTIFAPVRFGTRSEVVFIRLVPEKQ